MRRRAQSARLRCASRLHRMPIGPADIAAVVWTRRLRESILATASGFEAIAIMTAEGPAAPIAEATRERRAAHAKLVTDAPGVLQQRSSHEHAVVPAGRTGCATARHHARRRVASTLVEMDTGANADRGAQQTQALRLLPLQ